jgi:uncharacterized protein involved in exopolysaccharide biosynthesis
VDSATKSSIPEDISVHDIAADFRRAKRFVIGSALFFAILGAAFGLVRHKRYQVTTVVEVAASDNSGRAGGLGALASQYGGLASIAGLNLTSGGKRDEAIAVLQSELLTENYIKNEGLIPVLFQSRWRRLLAHWGILKQATPTLWQANELFRKSIRVVSEEESTGLITLKITWIDPHVAARWANDLIRITNSYLREKAVVEAERHIAYLNDQASKTDVIEARTAIYSLLKDEVNSEMVAKGREEYALKVIDPAFAPEKQSTFGAVPLAIFGLLLGTALSVFAVLGRRILLSA